jgi:predicted nucleotidyltransferase
VDKIPVEIINLVKRYIKEIESRQKIRIRSAFLFGSFAKGNCDEWSDIDSSIKIKSEK